MHEAHTMRRTISLAGAVSILVTLLLPVLACGDRSEPTEPPAHHTPETPSTAPGALGSAATVNYSEPALLKKIEPKLDGRIDVQGTLVLAVDISQAGDV